MRVENCQTAHWFFGRPVGPTSTLRRVIAFLHGEAGGWDELLIAAVALGVLWVAVKLAGRKSGDDEPSSEQSEPEASERSEEQDHEPVEPPAPRR